MRLQGELPVSEIHMSKSAPVPEAYESPELIHYGALANLTNSGGSRDIEGSTRIGCVRVDKLSC